MGTVLKNGDINNVDKYSLRITPSPTTLRDSFTTAFLNMNSIQIISLAFLTFASYAGAAECESGWVPFKDELCIKAFTDLLPYEEAKEFCISQGSEISKASLVMIKDPELQDLLANYTHDMFNTLWLGGKYDEESSQFKWDDGEPLTYTNWQEGYPRNSTTTPCIELRPINTKVDLNTEGLWADVNCQKQNQVMCQKALTWTLQDAINEILRTRKELETTKEDLQSTKDDLQATKQDLQVVSSRVVPVGSIYIEYYNQPSPNTLWPNLSWDDITSLYAGLFFRASGSGSGSWGAIQNECAPNISQVEYKWVDVDGSYPTLINLTASGWSEWIRTGLYRNDADNDYRDIHRFYTQACEVRPRNQAVRVWKRVA